VTLSENVRGKIFVMGGISGVCSSPEYRRKGNVRSLLLTTFKYMKDHNMPVSTLFPFKESFYTKLGYVSLPLPRLAVFQPKALSHLIKKDFGGKIVRKELNESSLEEFYTFVSEIQKITHGFAIGFGSKRLRFAWFDHYWVAYADVDGKHVGVIVYSLGGLFKRLKVRLFSYLTSQAKYILLSWLALHTDQASEVAIPLRSDEHIESWFDDANIDLEKPPTPSNTGGMGRVMIVSELNGMILSKATSGKCFIAKISDPLCEWNNNCYSFTSLDGVLQVAIVKEDTVPFNLSIQGLSALIYFGIDPGDLEYRDWGNPSKEEQVLLREMFPPAYPILFENF